MKKRFGMPFNGPITALRAMREYHPTGQCNDSAWIFHHIYHIGCAFNLHSIINNGLTPGGQDSYSSCPLINRNGLVLGGQNLSRRQTVFFLPVDPRNEDHKDPEHIDYSAPRLARYLQNAWKRHQDTVFWVDIDLGIREGLMFYQTRSNTIILQGTLPAHLYFY